MTSWNCVIQCTHGFINGARRDSQFPALPFSYQQQYQFTKSEGMDGLIYAEEYMLAGFCILRGQGRPINCLSQYGRRPCSSPTVAPPPRLYIIRSVKLYSNGIYSMRIGIHNLLAHVKYKQELRSLQLQSGTVSITETR